MKTSDQKQLEQKMRWKMQHYIYILSTRLQTMCNWAQ